MNIQKKVEEEAEEQKRLTAEENDRHQREMGKLKEMGTGAAQVFFKKKNRIFHEKLRKLRKFSLVFSVIDLRVGSSFRNREPRRKNESHSQDRKSKH